MKRFLHILAIAAMFLPPALSLAQSADTTGPVEEAERAALFPTGSMIEQGRTVAQAACAGCHGMDGISADPQQPHLAGQRAVYLYRVMQAYQDGSRADGTMAHASGFVNDEGLLAVAAYYANLPPARSGSPGESDAEQALNDDPFNEIQPALQRCSKCHDDTGNSSASGMPSLTAQHPEYFKTSMHGYVDGSRKHTIMKRLVERLDEPTIEAMGLYYAVQEPVRSETQGEGNELAGRRLARDCASCHGEDGNASAPDMPTLAGQDARYFVKAMTAYGDGERKHQPMFEAVANLSEVDIADLATFYAAREPQRRAIRKPFTAAELIDRCERCHGLDGNSQDPRFPMLAGQNAGYLVSALRDYAGESRGNSAMHAMAGPLSAADIESLALYFASREPKSVVYLQLPCTDERPE